jgi:hypothetical protein
MTELTGGCFCGAVRYRVTGAPLAVSHCHCASCRRACGAPFITWMTLAAGDFAYTSGTPRAYRSSARVRRAFCPTCGTTLAYSHDDHPEEVDVAAATLDEPARVRPDDHLWIGEKLPWIVIGDALPRLERAHWDAGYPDRDGS